ncbi:MAG: hypothetical protein R3Y63_14550 [Eubacteriales bacterium]
MAKTKTKVVVKSHYVGTKSMVEVFSPVLKQQVEQSILQQVTENSDKDLQNTETCGKIIESNLLSESEDVC